MSIHINQETGEEFYGDSSEAARAKRSIDSEMADLIDQPVDFIYQALATSLAFEADKDPRLCLVFPKILGLVKTAFYKIANEGSISQVINQFVEEGRIENFKRGMLATFSELIEAEDPVMAAESLAFVSELNIRTGKSQSDIARKRGCGRANVSKHCKKMLERYDLPIPSSMRSEKVVEIYRNRQLNKSSRSKLAVAQIEAWRNGDPVPVASVIQKVTTEDQDLCLKLKNLTL